MKIEGLKVFADKGWSSDSSFMNDNGVSTPIPANHKVVCQDENGDIVNVTFVTSQPLSLKLGEVLKGVTLIGGVSKTRFGWTVKAEFSK